MIARALALNPNLRMAWHVSGHIKVWQGEPETALEHFAKAERLSPLDPLLFNTHAGIAHAHFFAGRYDEAVSWAAKALRERPSQYFAMRIAAASLGLAGSLAEARSLVDRLRQINPALRVSNLKDGLGPYRPEPLRKLEEGLRRAGLPE
jgi:tetratricopeptide (TPR) repeat protein